MKRFVMVLVTALSMFFGGLALATHSPTGDQTPGRHHIWTERPFYGTNEPALGHSQTWIIGHSAITNTLGPFTEIRLLSVENDTVTDISGEGNFGGLQGKRVITVGYNNQTCDLRPDRSGHLAHIEWVQAHPAVPDLYRHVGLNVDTKGYRMNVPLGSLKSLSIRVFNDGADFPETETNTRKLACYDLVSQQNLKV